MSIVIEFTDRPGQYYTMEQESDAAWEVILREANLWKPGEYWPDFEQYEPCEVDDAELYLSDLPYWNIGCGGGYNSGVMGQPIFPG